MPSVAGTAVEGRGRGRNLDAALPNPTQAVCVWPGRHRLGSLPPPDMDVSARSSAVRVVLSEKIHAEKKKQGLGRAARASAKAQNLACPSVNGMPCLSCSSWWCGGSCCRCCAADIALQVRRQPSGSPAPASVCFELGADSQESSQCPDGEQNSRHPPPALEGTAFSRSKRPGKRAFADAGCAASC